MYPVPAAGTRGAEGHDPTFANSFARSIIILFWEHQIAGSRRKDGSQSLFCERPLQCYCGLSGLLGQTIARIAAVVST